ncbi:hypothetical protein JKP88DRAFT_301534 [Tribonema minus]|uniref:Fungal lipase-like domain-containing protein n=1 Tax=Tribonema minus TaxID=303371 RepID=A0A836CL88_9STRA|nr:hypothetical protein JKP88DRAFT_301534 [Tribonema minus]
MVLAGAVWLLLCCVISCSSGVLGYGWSTLEWQWPTVNTTTIASYINANITTLLPGTTPVPPPVPSRQIITFVNGIFHSEEDWQRITEQLDDIFKQEVRAFYNPSTGWWVADLAGAGFDLVRRSDTHSVARALALHLREALELSGPRGRVLHLAHSGGALMTYLAAKYHLRAAERARIDVVTFGGARSITRKYFSGRTVNYYARNDPLVILDRRAASLMKGAANETYQEVVYAKHNTTFVFMEGMTRSPFMDHSLEGPTYKIALEIEARNLLDRARESPSPLPGQAYATSWVRAARKRAAAATGLHSFWDETLGLRRARKAAAARTGAHGFFSGKHRARPPPEAAALAAVSAATQGQRYVAPLPLPPLEELRARRREQFLYQREQRMAPPPRIRVEVVGEGQGEGEGAAQEGAGDGGKGEGKGAPAVVVAAPDGGGEQKGSPKGDQAKEAVGATAVAAGGGQEGRRPPSFLRRLKGGPAEPAPDNSTAAAVAQVADAAANNSTVDGSSDGSGSGGDGFFGKLQGWTMSALGRGSGEKGGGNNETDVAALDGSSDAATSFASGAIVDAATPAAVEEASDLGDQLEGGDAMAAAQGAANETADGASAAPVEHMPWWHALLGRVPRAWGGAAPASEAAAAAEAAEDPAPAADDDGASEQSAALDAPPPAPNDSAQMPGSPSDMRSEQVQQPPQLAGAPPRKVADAIAADDAPPQVAEADDAAADDAADAALERALVLQPYGVDVLGGGASTWVEEGVEAPPGQGEEEGEQVEAVAAAVAAAAADVHIAELEVSVQHAPS